MTTTGQRRPAPMKVTIEPTDQLVTLVCKNPDAEIPARIWTGTTDTGIEVQVLVTRIAVSLLDDYTEFNKALHKTRAPIPEVLSYPLRMIL